MTLHIDVSAEMEARLRIAAQREGLAPEEFVKDIIQKELTPEQSTAPVNSAAIEMLNRWDLEDTTDDPIEIARQVAEFEELKAALNRNREISDGPHARKLFQ